MAINVICQSCGASLRVPDTVAGKKIKCPKCSGITRVPAAATPPHDDETLAGAPAEAVSTVRTKKGKSDGSRQFQPEDTDSPQRRSRKRKPAKSKGMGLWLAIGGAAFVLVAIILIVVVMILPSGQEKPVAAASAKEKTTGPKSPPLAEIEEPLPQQPKAPDVVSPANPSERTAMLFNLRQLGVALHSYHEENKTFPMPSMKGGPDKLSWRVAILPYIEQRGLYNKFKLDEPWDSEHNKNVLESFPMPKFFVSPREKQGEEHMTYLQLFTGPGTCFPTLDAKRRINSITSGPSSTWLVAESKTPVEWTRPDDIRVVEGQAPALGGVFSGDFFVLCADGTPHYIFRNQFQPSSILSLINPSNDQPVAGWPPE
jgi:Protein of unknown function (DUF1559)